MQCALCGDVTTVSVLPSLGVGHSLQIWSSCMHHALSHQLPSSWQCAKVWECARYTHLCCPSLAAVMSSYSAHGRLDCGHLGHCSKLNRSNQRCWQYGRKGSVLYMLQLFCYMLPCFQLPALGLAGVSDLSAQLVFGKASQILRSLLKIMWVLSICMSLHHLVWQMLQSSRYKQLLTSSKHWSCQLDRL